MQRLETKLNVMAPVAIINTVIKKKKTDAGNQTWVSHATSKYATHCATVNDMSTIQDLRSNKEECVK
jgi:hypothetical protein